MSNEPLPLHVGDISGFAKTLRRQLDGLDQPPSHVEMLNLLARAGGFRNFQHLKAQQTDTPDYPATETPLSDLDRKRIKQILRHFDGEGRLVRWPGKFTLRMMCLWVMWSRTPARIEQTELEINGQLNDNHLFEDHALLRREMVDRGFLKRTDDGRKYTRIEQQPPAEIRELFRQIRTD